MTSRSPLPAVDSIVGSAPVGVDPSKMFEITVGESEGATTKGVIEARTIALGQAKPYDVSGYFEDGAGNGMIKNYHVTSGDNAIVFARIDESGDLTMTGFKIGGTTVTVTAIDDNTDGDDGTAMINMNPVQVFAVTVGTVAGDAVITPLDPVAPTFKADGNDPGDQSWYTLNYRIDGVFNGGLHTMNIKLEGFDVPSSIGTSSIAMEVTERASDSGFDRGSSTLSAAQANSQESFTFNPGFGCG